MPTTLSGSLISWRGRRSSAPAHFEHVRAEGFAGGDGARGDHVVADDADLRLQVAGLAVGAAHADGDPAEQALAGPGAGRARLAEAGIRALLAADFDAALQALLQQSLLQELPRAVIDRFVGASGFDRPPRAAQSAASGKEGAGAGAWTVARHA